jgi:hypothetical protein
MASLLGCVGGTELGYIKKARVIVKSAVAMAAILAAGFMT